MSLDASTWAVIEGRPDLLYSTGPTLTKFHADRHKFRLRVVRAPNRVGKTLSGAWEAGRSSLEAPGSVGGVLVADLQNHYPTISASIHEVIARSELDSATQYVPGKGYFRHGRRGIGYRNGSRWEFRSGRSELMALAATRYDWLWVDEIPYEAHLVEALRALATTGGPCWVTFTPIGRPVAYFRNMIEGDAETGAPPTTHWEQYVPSLSVEECPWRTREDIEAQVALVPHWERPQRIHGAWEGPSGDRLFASFRDAPPPDGQVIRTLPPGNFRVDVSVDHGEVAGHQYACVLYHRPGAVIIASEYRSKRATTIEEDAEGIREALRDVGLGVNHVDRWTGDVNTAGKSGVEGLTLNDQLGAALGVRVGKPRKGPGSVGLGERMIEMALHRGELLVHRRCAVMRAALAHYVQGDGGDPSHPVAALRYATLPILSRWGGDYSRLIVGH